MVPKQNVFSLLGQGLQAVFGTSNPTALRIQQIHLTNFRIIAHLSLKSNYTGRGEKKSIFLAPKNFTPIFFPTKKKSALPTDILDVVIKGTESQTIPPELWNEFVELPLANVLTMESIQDTFQRLAMSCWKTRLQQPNVKTVNHNANNNKTQKNNYGILYEVWKPYLSFFSKACLSNNLN